MGGGQKYWVVFLLNHSTLTRNFQLKQLDKQKKNKNQYNLY